MILIDDDDQFPRLRLLTANLRDLINFRHNMFYVVSSINIIKTLKIFCGLFLFCLFAMLS